MANDKEVPSAAIPLLYQLHAYISVKLQDFSCTWLGFKPLLPSDTEQILSFYVAIWDSEDGSWAGQGCAGPPVDLEGVSLSEEQREKCHCGLDERQLRMLKAQVLCLNHFSP